MALAALTEAQLDTLANRVGEFTTELRHATTLTRQAWDALNMATWDDDVLALDADYRDAQKRSDALGTLVRRLHLYIDGARISDLPVDIHRSARKAGIL